MKKKTGKHKEESGLLGSVLTLGLGDTVSDHIEKAYEEEKERIEKSDYYEKCPACGRRQVKRNLMDNGCFICGWKGSEEEIELAKVKKMSKADIGSEAEKEERGYRRKCPNCNALLISEQFEKNGCYVCGFRE